MGNPFVAFADDKRFIDSSDKGMPFEFVKGSNAEKVAYDTRIDKIELRGFDNPFGEISVIGRK
jgi:hypothetical protein